jgi:small subunit ribosomal protein S9
MKIIHTSGKRKRAIARATLKPGKGKVRINKMIIDHIQPKLSRHKLREPLILAGATAEKVDINVNVKGGGHISQAEAARLAIARAIVQYDKKLEDSFLKYDRHLLIADVRRKEASKPNMHGHARSKRQKSYR